MSGESCSFLPSQKVTTKVSGEINAVIGFQECLVGTFVILAAGPGNPGALTERDLFPNDIRRTTQVLAMARMQSFNRSTRRGYFGFDSRQLVEGRDALH